MEESQQPEQQPEQQTDQLQLKQELLQAEILEKNYDQMEFLQYCTSQKENGDDLNNWTYDELKTCVLNFQESVQKKEAESKKASSLNFFLSNAKQNPQASQPQIQQQPYNNMNVPNQIPYNNQPYQNYSPYQQNNQQNFQQYAPYQQNPSQYPAPNNFTQGGVPNQQPQTPVAIQSVNFLNSLQQMMLNSEKMQQKINTDIQNVNLEQANQAQQPKKNSKLFVKKQKNLYLMIKK